MKDATVARWLRETADWSRKFAPSPTLVTVFDAWVNRSPTQTWHRAALAFLLAASAFAVLSAIATMLEIKAERLERHKPFRLTRRRDMG